MILFKLLMASVCFSGKIKSVSMKSVKEHSFVSCSFTLSYWNGCCMRVCLCVPSKAAFISTDAGICAVLPVLQHITWAQSYIHDKIFNRLVILLQMFWLMLNCCKDFWSLLTTVWIRHKESEIKLILSTLSSSSGAQSNRKWREILLTDLQLPVTSLFLLIRPRWMSAGGTKLVFVDCVLFQADWAPV